MIKTLLEQNGISFVNRSYGQVTSKTVTLGTLEKVEKTIKINTMREISSYLREIGRLDAANDVELKFEK